MWVFWGLFCVWMCVCTVFFLFVCFQYGNSFRLTACLGTFSSAVTLTTFTCTNYSGWCPWSIKKTFIETLMSSFIRLMTVNIITNTNTNTNTYIPTYIQSCILQLTSTAWTCSESFIMMIRDGISDYKCTPVRNMPTAVNSCMSSFSRD